MIKLNTDKTRYAVGQVMVEHKGIVVNTTVGHPANDLLVQYMNRIYDFDIGYIPAGYAHRPDTISELFYNSPGYWWLIMQANNISDPFEQLNVGDRILIPKL